MGTSVEARYWYARSFEAFHVGQSSALRGEATAAIARLQVSLEDALASPEPDVDWTAYVRGTSAYLQSDRSALERAMGKCRTNKAVLCGLLFGLDERAAPEYERDYGRFRVTDISSHCRKSPEELADGAVRSLLRLAREKPDTEMWICEWEHLPSELPLETALRKKAARCVAAYRESIEEKREAFTAQAEHCVRLLRKNGWSDARQPVQIVIVDRFLAQGAAGQVPVDQYEYESGTVFIDRDRPNILLAHELGHLFSHWKEGNRDHCGFIYHEEKPDGTRVQRGNQWFNEGATVLWENIAVNDGSTLAERNEGMDFYPFSRDMVRLLLHDLDLQEGALFRAYFGEAGATGLLEKRIQERYGCPLEDLSCLSLKLDTGWAERVLRGKPETIETFGTEDQGVLAEKRKLTEIFPNVTLTKADDAGNASDARITSASDQSASRSGR
ncbi:MAG: hypothetical protein Greene041619_838 [Candidatus Peregrinibacteria bacterium Greene0416_19]|nr:MAG: hypothetical protein Greene041619_838 [Candidatus Peregrinibacteria bacterium Greene0416_19]